jgi:hypothetical protein
VTAEYYVMSALLDVVQDNPMYGSHALVLQLDNAIDRRFKEYEEAIIGTRRKKNEDQRS